MAEIWGAAIVAGGAIGGSLLSSSKQKKAAKKAAKAQQEAADKAAAATEQNYQRTQTNLQPYISAGNDAVAKINAVNNGDYTGFESSPDYLVARDQGIAAQDRGAAARGGLYSGGHSADLATFASDLASKNLNQYYSRLTGLAALGQSSATGLGSIGNGAAAQSGNFNLAGAGATAQGAYDSANANSSLYGNIGGALGQFAGSISQPSPTSSSYSAPGSQPNAGLLGGGNYSGPGSTSTTWGTNSYSALGRN
jgi:hypothetical protein